MTVQLDPLVAVLVVIGVLIWVAADLDRRRVQARRRRRPDPPIDPVLASIIRDLLVPDQLEEITVNHGKEPNATHPEGRPEDDAVPGA